ncbi:hypothetical protein [Longicatena caecimuris]|uniref:hypothetical protein n=1 Tax=Longicatena caecimuris TaxID=1796635 RepID=UPI0018AA5CBC|nr:hypothetical protein [Longicatena caecimuris]
MKAFLWQLLTIQIIGVYDSAIAVILKERFDKDKKDITSQSFYRRKQICSLQSIHKK